MLQDRSIPVNNNPRLPGALLSRRLTVSVHVNKINTDQLSKAWAMKVISHSTWWLQKLSLKTMYHNFIRSKMVYGAPV